MPIVEYPAGTPFSGVVGRTAEESSPAWPATPRAAQNAPNVLIVVLDDTGFGQLGCYGSPISTPNFDELAARGVRFNNMHTTALSFAEQVLLLTGRNHSNGMASITRLATGFAGYNGVSKVDRDALAVLARPWPLDGNRRWPGHCA